MLKVNTSLGQSSIPNAGIGLFAEQDIPKDTIIWEFTSEFDAIWTEEEMNDVKDDLLKKFLKTYCFKYQEKYYLCVDNARFFNHSEDPNCYSSDFNDTTLGFTRAKRDIKKGEELTDDYGGFGFDEKDKEFNLDI